MTLRELLDKFDVRYNAENPDLDLKVIVKVNGDLWHIAEVSKGEGTPWENPHFILQADDA